MQWLELKLPPLLWVLLFGVAMWGLDRWLPGWRLGFAWYLELALALALLGLGLILVGAWQFRRARTSVNPLDPDKASTLVSGGLYRVSRNPMYLGFLLLLLDWALFLAHPLALALLPLFVLCLNQFQIRPEERRLEVRFGQDYRDYCRRVRRWI